MTEHRLVMIAPAPVQRASAGRLRLDVKFVEGMRQHRAQWRGPVHCILWEGRAPIPFGADYPEAELGFGLTLLSPGQSVLPEHLAGAAVVSASADLPAALDLAGLSHAAGAKLFYNIEYTLGTRLKIVALDRSRGVLRKARSILWNLTQERRRRAAFRAADGIQFNGYPARDAYGRLTANGLLYLDGRMRREMMASPAEIAAKSARLAAGAELRIVHSGRLVTMKGAQDLLPIAKALRGLGQRFRLDIFGSGDLEAEIVRGIAAEGLQDQVRLHAPVDFENALVPWLRAEADVFLSCHRQADPSCSYLEALSCGVPVIGYDNPMWRAMCEKSKAGWSVPMGEVATMAARLAVLARNPAEITAAAARGRDFGAAHDFETEFARRMAHLAGGGTGQVARPGDRPARS